MRCGTAVVFPRAAAGVHRVFNTADEPARAVIVSMMNFPELAEHVDTGTWAGGDRAAGGQGVPRRRRHPAHGVARAGDARVRRARRRRLSSVAAVPTIDHAVVLRGAGRRYGERAALRDVSLELEPGLNGAGKTTLLRMLATLLRPHAGEVRVLGHELPDDGYAVRGRIGFLGHEPLLYRELSGRENLRFHARLHRVAPARVEAVLDDVGMRARADDPVAELSRGMVQRLAIARAVLHEPELLLLDEPLANLDPAAAAQVEPLIGRASGRTRVLTSHDPAGGLAGADLALGLKGGRVALLAPAGAVAPEQIAGLYA
jgi:heme exporter protein A